MQPCPRAQGLAQTGERRRPAHAAALPLARRDLRRLQVLATLLEQGQVSGPALEGAQQEYEQLAARQRRQHFMLLQLDPGARAGEPRPVDEVRSQPCPRLVPWRTGSRSCAQIPIYAHVKEVVDSQGRREALEVNYMT